MTAAAEHLKKRQITSCLGRTGQHARPSRKHCKPCDKHAHHAPLRARARLYKFHSVGNSIQPVPVHINNDLKQQRHGAGETSRNDKLRVAWEGMGNTRACLANTANRAPNMLTHHRHVRVHVCTVSIEWVFQTNPDQSSEPTSSNTNVIGAGETSRNDKLRVAWEGLGNTRARRANTANRSRTTATCACMFARYPLCGTFNPTRTSPVKQPVETTT